MGHYILAIDQGTLSTKACIYDDEQYLIASAQQALPQSLPQIGRVEYDPDAIWHSCLAVCHQVLAQSNLNASQMLALGIANQRETTLVWHKETGQVLTPAIAWQDRRTLEYCKTLKAGGLEPWIQAKTGLLLDAYFSATKLHWILERIPRAKSLADQGLLAFGTVETYLVWRFTAGASHVTDVSNASRTLLMNIHTRQWDDELLQLFGIPHSMLPHIVNNTGDFGCTEASLFGAAIPITGLAGNLTAAMIGQACIQPGQLKALVGTGAFLLLNTGSQVVTSQHRLLSSVAYQVGDELAYVLEGSVLNTGMAVQWLMDPMKLIQSEQETEALARSLSTNDGFYLVPSFTGLAAPYWQGDIRAMCCGISRATTRAHFARGALEAVAYQLLDIKIALEQDAGIAIHDIRIGGALTSNEWFLQFWADMFHTPLLMASAATEVIGKGAALLAAIGSGVYSDLSQATQHWRATRLIVPTLAETTRQRNHQGWQKALQMLFVKDT